MNPNLIKRVRTPGELAEWQRVIAERYCELGFATLADCEDGRLRDKYDENALHFFVGQGALKFRGTFRLVHTKGAGGLPISEVFDVERVFDPSDYIEVTRMSRGEKSAERPVTFLALAYALALVGELKKSGILAMVDPGYFLHFNRIFADALQPISGCEPKKFRGGWLIAARVIKSDFDRTTSHEVDMVKKLIVRIPAHHLEIP